MGYTEDTQTPTVHHSNTLWLYYMMIRLKQLIALTLMTTVQMCVDERESEQREYFVIPLHR